MFCRKCGKELQDKAAFCGSCGNPVSEALQIPPGDTRRSPVNEASQVKRTDHGPKKKLSLWNVHKVKNPGSYGGYGSLLHKFIGLLSLSWPIGVILYFLNFKSQSQVRRCQGHTYLMCAGVGFVLMLLMIAANWNVVSREAISSNGVTSIETYCKEIDQYVEANPALGRIFADVGSGAKAEMTIGASLKSEEERQKAGDGYNLNANANVWLKSGVVVVAHCMF